MLKKFSKLLLILLIAFIVSSSSLVCLADEIHEHSDNETTVQTTEDSTTSDENTTGQLETHVGDLYLFDNDIVMDKYVDGNVFLCGNNVKISGTVNGNLFVFADTVTFDNSLVRYSIFACANSVYYNGGCGNSNSYDYGNLYVMANNFESTYYSYVTGDIKSMASKVTLKSAVGRDVDLICNTLNIGEGEDIPIIYGNLRYTANNEITIPDGLIVGGGSANYTKLGTTTYSITSILIGFATCIVTVLALYTILRKSSPKFTEKISNQKFSITKLLKAFAIGIASIVVISILIILLAGTVIGVRLSAILALLFVILCIIAVPTLTISITSKLKHILKLEKASVFYLVLSLVSIILYGITLIPYAGIILGFVINVTSIGLIINIYLPHKELSEEEKLAREEAKELAKENKEKRKQEKLEAKTAKKQEKLGTKEAKKNDKEN